MIGITTTGPNLANLEFWSKEAMREVVTLTLEHYLFRIFVQKVGADGTPYPEGVDMVKSEDFRHGLRARVLSQSRATIKPSRKTAWYVRFHQERIGWAGLSRLEQDLFDASLDTAVDLALKNSGA